MKKSKILLNLTSFFCFIYFAFYIFTLVFIPIGIYCFLAGKNFSYKAEHLDDTMKLSNLHFKRYVIFVCIFCFPFGFLAIIPYKYLTSNNIVISNLKYVNVEDIKPVEENVTESQENSSMAEENQQPVETEQEKIEKFKKLQSFKEKGFITEEELEQAREQIFGKKE
jgi:hypothetical protein